MSKLPIALALLPILGCAANSGTQPQDMSATQHQAAAERAERAAGGHEAGFDPHATKEESVCGQAGTVRPNTFTGPPCWTSRSNPTARHEEDSARFHQLAAEHRAASAALAEAERAACTGIDDADRDTSPFYHREDIIAIEAIGTNAPYYSKEIPTDRAIGATIMFKPVPGLTAQWLQHEVNCHIARAAALGHQMPEMAFCPLVLKNVSASVGPRGDSLQVRVVSEDSDTAKEILRRAQALVARAP